MLNQISSFTKAQLVAELNKLQQTYNPEMELCYGYTPNGQLVIVEAYLDWTDEIGDFGIKDLYKNRQLVPAHKVDVTAWLRAY